VILDTKLQGRAKYLWLGLKNQVLPDLINPLDKLQSNNYIPQKEYMVGLNERFC
jgi:hypothetical protein